MKEIYNIWLKKAIEDKDIVEELNIIDEEGVKDRFYKELSFGTGGLRGVIGAGINRMNIYTVRKVTQGLCDYLNVCFEKPSIAIAYDSRKNSFIFAKTAAEVFIANNVFVYIYNELMPTPMLSFAVRELNCSGGIVVTASHNPAEYNGYKVYGSDGCQITLEAAEKITKFISKIDIFSDVKHRAIANIHNCRGIKIIDEDTISKYFSKVYECKMLKAKVCDNIRIVYSPLNGAGKTPIKTILNMIGCEDIIMVREQQNPDETFATCPYPNPEEKEALKLGLSLAKETEADLLLATDPDCDRVGTAVNDNGKYVLISGNQMGILLLDFICKMRVKNSNMPKNPIAIKTIVTTEMAQAIANDYNVELINVLTGFKFIGEQIALLENENCESRYIFGFEESYGYLSGTYARDKDAVNASMLICEMVSYYKHKNKALTDVLKELYEKYGYFYDKLQSFAFEGAKGMSKMQNIMKNLRDNRIDRFGKIRVASISDYLVSEKYMNEKVQKINLPISDVIGYQLENGSSIVVRPSGTEPKLKVYYSLKCDDENIAIQMFDEFALFIKEKIINYKLNN